jgi:hypothetical protein
MKTLKTLSALVFAAGVLFTSCSKKDNTTSTTTPVSNNPTISLAGGTGYVAADYTATVGSSAFTIKALSAYNGTSKSNLVKVVKTITTNNVPVSVTDTIAPNGANFADSLVINPSAIGTSRVQFTVTDKAGLTASVAINITVVAPTVIPIGTTGAAITLGGSLDSNPSYISLQTGTTYHASAVTSSNAANIQLSYSKTYAYSPSDALETNTTVKGAGIVTYVDVYTAKAYSAITAADINAYTPTGTTNVHLAAGTIVMFYTSTGKKGVFYVSTFNGSTTSSTDNISILGQVQQ